MFGKFEFLESFLKSLIYKISSTIKHNIFKFIFNKECFCIIKQDANFHDKSEISHFIISFPLHFFRCLLNLEWSCPTHWMRK